MRSGVELGLSNQGIEGPSVEIRPFLLDQKGVSPFRSAHLENAINPGIAGAAFGREIEIIYEMQSPELL